VLKKIRQGLCSRYIASLQENCELKITFEENAKFYDLLKKEPARPVIMIAPGTGGRSSDSQIQPHSALHMRGQNLVQALIYDLSAKLYHSSRSMSLFDISATSNSKFPLPFFFFLF